jgi:hypothetical protein
MVPIEQKDGTNAAVEMVDFPLPLPARCRACGKRKRQLVVGTVDWRRSGGGETISVIGFDEAASGGHGGQPLIEAGGADAAASSLGSLPADAVRHVIAQRWRRQAHGARQR